MTPDAPPLSFPFPESLREAFVPIRLLGQGGFGAVFECREERTGRRVALKLMLSTGSSAISERFRREAQGLARMHHPNVLRVFDFGTVDEGPYLVLEYLDGVSLDALTGDQDWVGIMLDAAAGLECVHGCGLLHRDLKPENLMRTREGRVVLVDFGLARDPRRTRITRTGEVVGTLAYVRPGRLRGEEDGPGDDWYAWGVTLYRLVEGRLPFAFEDLLASVRDSGSLTLETRRLAADSPVAILLRAMLLGARVPEELRSREGIQGFLEAHGWRSQGPTAGEPAREPSNLAPTRAFRAEEGRRLACPVRAVPVGEVRQDLRRARSFRVRDLQEVPPGADRREPRGAGAAVVPTESAPGVDRNAVTRPLRLSPGSRSEPVPVPRSNPLPGRGSTVERGKGEVPPEERARAFRLSLVRRFLASSAVAGFLFGFLVLGHGPPDSAPRAETGSTRSGESGRSNGTGRPSTPRRADAGESRGEASPDPGAAHELPPISGDLPIHCVLFLTKGQAFRGNRWKLPVVHLETDLENASDLVLLSLVDVEWRIRSREAGPPVQVHIEARSQSRVILEGTGQSRGAPVRLRTSAFGRASLRSPDGASLWLGLLEAGLPRKPETFLVHRGQVPARLGWNSPEWLRQVDMGLERAMWEARRSARAAEPPPGGALERDWPLYVVAYNGTGPAGRSMHSSSIVVECRMEGPASIFLLSSGPVRWFLERSSTSGPLRVHQVLGDEERVLSGPGFQYGKPLFQDDLRRGVLLQKGLRSGAPSFEAHLREALPVSPRTIVVERETRISVPPRPKARRPAPATPAPTAKPRATPRSPLVLLSGNQPSPRGQDTSPQERPLRFRRHLIPLPGYLETSRRGSRIAPASLVELSERGILSQVLHAQRASAWMGPLPGESCLIGLQGSGILPRGSQILPPLPEAEGRPPRWRESHPGCLGLDPNGLPPLIALGDRILSPHPEDWAWTEVARCPRSSRFFAVARDPDRKSIWALDEAGDGEVLLWEFRQVDGKSRRKTYRSPVTLDEELRVLLRPPGRPLGPWSSLEVDENELRLFCPPRFGPNGTYSLPVLQISKRNQEVRLRTVIPLDLEQLAPAPGKLEVGRPR